MPVLAVTKSIPGTSWYMVVKVDQDEVFAGLHREGKLIAAGAFTLVLLAGMSMGWALTAQRKGHYKELFRLENERQALLTHFEYLVKYANDIILFTDENLKIIEVNDRACEAYVYSREEMLNLNASDLRDPVTLAEMPEMLRRLEQEKGLVYETAHRRKDGSVFAVEASNPHHRRVGQEVLSGHHSRHQRAQAGDRKAGTDQSAQGGLDQFPES